MTSEEKIAQWKTMTEFELFKKYTPRLLSKELNDEQYKVILSYAKDKKPSDNPRPNEERIPLSDSISTAGLIEAFGGEEIPVEEEKKVSQKAKLLAFLSDNLWHDTPSIISAVYGVGHQGVCRISERIRENIADGHKIESRKKSRTIWEYRLLNPNTLV